MCIQFLLTKNFKTIQIPTPFMNDKVRNIPIQGYSYQF